MRIFLLEFFFNVFIQRTNCFQQTFFRSLVFLQKVHFMVLQSMNLYIISRSSFLWPFFKSFFRDIYFFSQHFLVLLRDVLLGTVLSRGSFTIFRIFLLRPFFKKLFSRSLFFRKLTFLKDFLAFFKISLFKPFFFFQETFLF